MGDCLRTNLDRLFLLIAWTHSVYLQKRVLAVKLLAGILEVHNGLTGLIVDNIEFKL